MNKHRTIQKYIHLILTRFSLLTLFFIPLFVLSIASSVQATTIQAVSVQEALEGSELVIEGRVTKSEARKSESSRMIHTYVTIEILEVIKGNFTEKILVLPFLGGKLGNKVMTVGEMEYPKVGEQGIYFVESLQNHQANSLYGWSQGHFLIREDADGIHRVTTRKNTPVTGVDKKTTQRQSRQALQAVSNQDSKQEFSQGEAKGLQLEEAAPISRAMTPKEFKQELSKMSAEDQGE